MKNNNKSPRRKSFLECCRSVLRGPLKLVLVLLHIVGVFLLWYYQDRYITYRFTGLYEFLDPYFFAFSIPILGTVFLIALIVLIGGSPIGSARIYNALCRKGVVNEMKESMILIAKYRSKYRFARSVVYLFDTNDLSFDVIRENQGKIEEAIRRFIVHSDLNIERGRLRLHTVKTYKEKIAIKASPLNGYHDYSE